MSERAMVPGRTDPRMAGQPGRTASGLGQPAPAPGGFIGRHPGWSAVIAVAAVLLVWLIVADWPAGLTAALGRKRVVLNAVLNGITLGGLYFLVASGFTLIFGLMRNVNLAHGTLYLLGGYIGYVVGSATGSWLLAFAAAALAAALLGLVLQVAVFRRMEGQDLRQTLVTIGISICIGDLMLWVFGGDFYQIQAPDALLGAVQLPIVVATKSNGAAVLMTYPRVRLVVFAASVAIGVLMWLALNRTRIGMMIRAGVDDRDMLAASGKPVQLVFAAVFAFGAGLAGLAGVVGGTFQSLAPGEDTHFLLASLVVVIVGGMGSIPGAALGALLIGLSEQVGIVYAPAYSVVFTFLIMVAVLAFRPAGLLGRAVAPGRAGQAMPQLASAVRRPAPGAWPGVRPAPLVVAAALLLLPIAANGFFLVQVFGWALVLGLIALSLTLLAGYGGMVSLVQMTVAGIAGYMVAILGDSGIHTISLGWPWWVAVPVALAIAVAFGTLSGALAVRTAGIYTIMITLAIASAFFYFTLQNYAIFNGFTGFNRVLAPHALGVDWRAPVPFYYLALFWAGLGYLGVVRLRRVPFGLALQGARDNARRMAALGFNVTVHRVAAYAIASLMAAVGGVLLVWLNGEIAPGTAGVGPVIDILVIAVIGGIADPIGAFIGALIFVLLRTFASDALVAAGLDGQRFQLLIGLGFLLIVFFSPDGVLGLWARLRARRPARA
jgi:branched-chain amino acid transport system permease protein